MTEKVKGYFPNRSPTPNGVIAGLDPATQKNAEIETFKLGCRIKSGNDTG